MRHAIAALPPDMKKAYGLPAGERYFLGYALRMGAAPNEIWSLARKVRDLPHIKRRSRKEKTTQ